MNRHAVSTDHAPAALGPYSQAIVAGGFVFCSGTAGIDPETGSIPMGIEAQTDQALQNVAAILKAAGASMTDLVKTTIFYSDVADFATLNEVYARHMPDPPPARSAPANVRLPHGLLCPSRPSPHSRANAPPAGHAIATEVACRRHVPARAARRLVISARAACGGINRETAPARIKAPAPASRTRGSCPLTTRRYQAWATSTAEVPLTAAGSARPMCDRGDAQ